MARLDFVLYKFEMKFAVVYFPEKLAFHENSDFEEMFDYFVVDRSAVNHFVVNHSVANHNHRFLAFSAYSQLSLERDNDDDEFPVSSRYYRSSLREQYSF